MNFLIIGLGSMGKRRIRCLSALGYPQENIVGFDLRADRRAEVLEKHGVQSFDDFEAAAASRAFDAYVISVPPDVHHIYMKAAVARKIPFFVEASVVDTDMGKIDAEAKAAGVVAAPSATLLFHPAIRAIEKMVKSGELGVISNIIFHCGQYLPDWHTYEKVEDYYVSNPLTGGAREITPFELTWITRLFGFPRRVCGQYRKTIHIEGAEKIEDTYNFLMDYGDRLATVTIDVVSRFATRRLLINGDKKQLRWDWDEKTIRVFDGATQAWTEVTYEMLAAEHGYNANIGENMYIEELGSFIRAVKGEAAFINTLENDHRVLKILYAVEESDRQSRFIELAS